MSKRGKPIIQIGSYRFSKRYQSKGNKDQWLCTRVVSIHNITSRQAGDRNQQVSLQQAFEEHWAEEAVDKQLQFKQKALLSDQPIFTLSRFGKPVITIGRYRFNKSYRSRGPKASWICSLGSSKCRALLTTIDDVIVKANNNHTH
ncbi:FLYWCH zinc finger domain-containing protein [Phthorimaea operculella]|nr:FLYWCH zinc finger domain-containing protein [Phthorimaea operculella]